MFLATHGVIRNNSGGGYTARTTAYATATGITDLTILGALNTWDLYIISKGLDTVYKQALFLATGSSGSAVINFMNPSIYTASAYGGLIFSNLGVKGNQANSYLNSNFKPSTQLASQNSIHMSFYSNLTDNSISWSSYLGAYDGNRLHYYHNYLDNYMGVNTSGIYSNSPSFLNKGTFLLNRNNSSNFSTSNGIVTNTFTNSSTPLISANIGIGRILGVTDNDVFNATFNLRYSFFTTGSGMTSSQQSFHHTGITNLMTTLGINI
jgi:hypothetical protein